MPIKKRSIWPAVPEVSIITPLYNSAQFVGDAVASVVAQTFTDWELIVVDDCSSDDSVRLVGSLVAADARIKLIKLAANAGAAVARNTGIGAATGRYIAFLDADDIWCPDKLQRQLDFMRANNCPFVFSVYDKITEDGKVLGRVDVPRQVNYRALLKTNVIGCSTAIYDTAYFGKVEMPLIRKRQDFGLWLRLLKKVDYACGINEPLAAYRVRKQSVSSNKLSVLSYNWQLYRQVEGLSLLASAYYFSHYAVRGVLRRYCPGFARWLG